MVSAYLILKNQQKTFRKIISEKIDLEMGVLDGTEKESIRSAFAINSHEIECASNARYHTYTRILSENHFSNSLVSSPVIINATCLNMCLTYEKRANHER